MLGLLSFLTLNENLNAIWLNAVGMSRYIQLNGSEGDSNTMAVTRPLLLNGSVRSMAQPATQCNSLFFFQLKCAAH